MIAAASAANPRVSLFLILIKCRQESSDQSWHNATHQFSEDFNVHIHILGICGTFMGGIAQLAKSLGIEVSGCDAGVYPPMSDQLKQAGIHLIEGYDPEQLDAGADLYIIGNAISRGNPLLEEILNRGLP